MNARKAAADPKLFRLGSRGFSTGNHHDHSLYQRGTTHSSTGAAPSMHRGGVGHSHFICLPFLKGYRTHEEQERVGMRISRRFFCVTRIKNSASPTIPPENEDLTVQSHSFWSVKHSRFVDVREKRAASVSDLSSSSPSLPLTSSSHHFTHKTASFAPLFPSPSTLLSSCTPQTTDSPSNGMTSPLPPPLLEQPHHSHASFVDGTTMKDRVSPYASEKTHPSAPYASPRRKHVESSPHSVSAPSSSPLPSHLPTSRTLAEREEGVLRSLSHVLPRKGKMKATATLEWEDTMPEWETTMPPLPHDVSRSRRSPRTKTSEIITVPTDNSGRSPKTTGSVTPSGGAFLYPGQEDLPPLTPPAPKSKFSFLAHFSDALAERNYNANGDVPNSAPKPKLPMWASSFTHPALKKERLRKDNWISQDASGFLSPSAREALEEWLTAWLTAAAATTTSEREKSTMTEVVKLMQQNIYVCPRSASFRGVFAKKSFRAGEVLFTIPLRTTTTIPTALTAVLPERALPPGQSTTPSSLLRRLSSFFRTTDSTLTAPSTPGPVALCRTPPACKEDTPTDDDTSRSTTPCHTANRSTGAAMQTESLHESLESCAWPCFSSSSHPAVSSLQEDDGAPHRLHDDGRDPSLSSPHPFSVASVLLPFTDVVEYIHSLRRSSLDPTPHFFFIEQVYLAMQLAVVLEDYEKRVKIKMAYEQKRREGIKTTLDSSPLPYSTDRPPASMEGRSTETSTKEHHRSGAVVEPRFFFSPSLHHEDATQEMMGKGEEEEEEVDHPSTAWAPTDATTSPPGSFSSHSFWAPYLYLLRYGVSPPSSSAFSEATSHTGRAPSSPSPLLLFDDEGIQERHRSVLEPQSFLEYSDLCLRFRHMLRGLHAKWWSYYDAVVLPSVLPRIASSSSFSTPVSVVSPPSLETLEWAFRVTLSRQRLLPQQRRAVSSFRDCEQYAMKMDKEEVHGWFAEMVMRMKWWVYDTVFGIVDRPRLWSNAIPDPTVMPAILPLVDLLQHASGGKANTTMTLEEGEECLHPLSPSPHRSSSSHCRPLYAVIRASEAIDEDEELTTLYSKCYSVAYTLYRYGALALHNRKEDVHHAVDEREMGEKKGKQEETEEK